MFSLEGKCCLVLGGSGGIGREVCIGLAEQGADVALTYRRRQDEADAVRTQIEGHGRRCITLPCDVVEHDATANAVEAAIKAFGHLDAVITTVGWHPFSALLEISDDDIEKSLDIELMSVIRLARSAIPHLVERGGGRFVVVGSDSGKTGNRGATISAAARGGVIAFVKSLAREFARDNVLANVVCPGPTDTDLWREEIGDSDDAVKIQQAMIRAIPLRRAGTAREVAGMAVYLVSDEASYVTGQALSVSGGLTMS